MVLSNDPPFLFIHVPKTAGSSIEESLFHYQSFDYSRVTHGISLQFKNYLNDDYFFSLFKFGFVRNPWDLQVSCWRYYIRNWSVNMTFQEYLDWKFFGSITDMLDRVPKEENIQPETLLSNAFYIHRTPQTYYFIDEVGNYLVDYIGSFENIKTHYDNICQKLSILDNFLPFTNSSLIDDETRDYKKYYDDRTKELIRSRFAMDIMLYGYKFDVAVPDETKMGEIQSDKKNLSNRGYKIPTDFYFSLYDVTYGMGGIRNVYEHEPEELIERRKKEFDNDLANRRKISLERNTNSINERILELEEFVVENDVSSTILEKTKREIQSLQERRLVYKLEIKKLKQFEEMINRELFE